jgi:hypothetical protein
MRTARASVMRSERSATRFEATERPKTDELVSTAGVKAVLWIFTVGILPGGAKETRIPDPCLQIAFSSCRDAADLGLRSPWTYRC